MKMMKLRHNQTVQVGQATILVSETSRGHVVLGIHAPPEVPIVPPAKVPNRSQVPNNARNPIA